MNKPYKPSSWQHAIIAAIVMILFYYFIPPLPVIIYAGLLPVVYFYGREVRDAELKLGATSLKFLTPLIPWLWREKDNRLDFYVPFLTVIGIGFWLEFWQISLR